MQAHGGRFGLGDDGISLPIAHHLLLNRQQAVASQAVVDPAPWGHGLTGLDPTQAAACLSASLVKASA